MRTQLKPIQTYEFEITETRSYYVQGDGHNPFEAQQDAAARFHRLVKSGEIVVDKISHPRIGKGKSVNRK